MAIVYFHRRKDTNEVFYVGIGKTISRSKSKNSRNELWWSIVNKVGYTIEVVHNKLSWEQAVSYEISYIKKYGRRDLGEGNLANMTDGGDGNQNIIIKDETREKLRLSSTGRKKSSDEIQKIREKNTGKTHSEETKEKIREINTGKTHSEETKRKMSESRKGKKHTLKSRKKISESRKGIVFTDEHKKNMSLSRLGKRTGKNNPNTKLTKEDVIWIRKNHIKGSSIYGARPLSRKFGVDPKTINNVVNLIIFKYIT